MKKKAPSITRSQIETSLIDRIVSEIGGDALTEPPNNAISVADLCERTGLGESRCWRILKDKTAAGQLKRVRVKLPGQTAKYFWVQP